MHVTIVIPSFNAGALLPGAIAAALAQSHADLGVLVVDDASTDDTGARLAPFRGHPGVALVRLARRVGDVAARNLGLLLAPGAAVSFHDVDDVPARDKIAAQIDALAGCGPAGDDADAGPRAPRRRLDGVLCGHVLIGADGSERTVRRMVRLLGDDRGDARECPIVGCGLFRRRLFERLGGFAATPGSERELLDRMLSGGARLGFVPRPLVTRLARPVAPRGAVARDAPPRPALGCAPIDASRFAVAQAFSRRPLRVNATLPVEGFHPSLDAFGARGAVRPALA